MRHTARPYAAFLGIILSSTLASAQQAASPRQSRTQGVKTAAKPSTPRPSGDDPLAEQQRVMALTLISSLANEANSFRDSVWRARAQARAANLLWRFERERARSLFRRAWEAATEGDRAAERSAEESRRQQRIVSMPSLRGEVLKLAAQRERTLGEEFFGKLSEAKGADPAATTTVAPVEDPLSLLSPLADTPRAKRLSLADELLKAGDVTRAIEFATPALDRVSIQAISFLSSLRLANPEPADRLYAALLMHAAGDPLADANTVSLLSSYTFTPLLFVVAMPGGPMAAQVGPPQSPPDIPAQLRSGFFTVASQILLRHRTPAELSRTTAGVAGTFLILTRLSPLFDRYAPEQSANLQAAIAALRPDAPESYRNNMESAQTQGLVPPDAQPDVVQSPLDQLDRTSDPRERDQLYFRAAMDAANAGDKRAIEFADKISADELRKASRQYVDLVLIREAIKKKELPEALRLAKAGNLTTIQRVWAYSAVAQQLPKSEVQQATQLLDEALIEARRIDPTEADRVRALIAVATRFYSLDRNRAWEMMGEITKAANAAPAFSGEGSGVRTSVQTAEGTFMLNFTESRFDLASIFGLLAKDDLIRAIELVKVINGEAPRAAASLAIAEAVLGETSDARTK